MSRLSEGCFINQQHRLLARQAEEGRKGFKKAKSCVRGRSAAGWEERSGCCCSRQQAGREHLEERQAVTRQQAAAAEVQSEERQLLQGTAAA